MDLLNTKLYSICFLDSLSLGFFVPILSTQIVNLGGNHITLGVLSSLYFIFQFVSSSVVRTLRQNYGTRVTLLGTVLLNCVLALFLGLTNSLLFVGLLRLISASTNQIQTLCKSFASEFNDPERYQSVLNVMNCVSVAGFIIGPIVGGTVYDSKDGFYHIASLSSLALLLAFFLSFKLPCTTENKKDRTDILFKLKEDLGSFKILKNLNIYEQWDPIILKTLYHTSTTLFFIKFSMLLKVNYHVSNTIVGYTYAYQSILAFLSQISFAILKNKFSENFNSNFLVFTLFSVTLSFFGLCFAPSYDYYLLAFIPMIFAHACITSSWKDMFALRSTRGHDIKNIDDALAKFVSIFAPIVLGISCDLYGHPAFQALVMGPLILALVISVLFNIERPMGKNNKKKE